MEYTLMKQTRGLALSAALAAAMITSQLAVTESSAAGIGSKRANFGATGLLISSNGVASSNVVGIGEVDVVFTGNITLCTAVASLTGNLSGSIANKLKTGTNNTITVKTFNAAGAVAKRSFAIIVLCG